MRISAHLGTEAVICIYEFNVAMAAAGAVSPKKGRKKIFFFFPSLFYCFFAIASLGETVRASLLPWYTL